MAKIYLETFIDAPIERVFDLSRSIDLHKLSTKATNEEAVAGKTKGLINLNETVTWKAKHLFKERMLKIKVTQLRQPDFFVDEQVKGDFAMMKHEHYFKVVENGTIMIDQFHFESPKGFL